jgi:hypothetical protein
MIWKLPLLALSTFASGFGMLHLSVLLQSYFVLTVGMVMLLVGSGVLMRRSERHAASS